MFRINVYLVVLALVIGYLNGKSIAGNYLYNVNSDISHEIPQQVS